MPFTTERFLRRVSKFIDFYEPTIVVLRNLEGHTRRWKQAHELVEAITKFAREKGLPVHSYSRNQVRDAFEVHGTKTKHEIAQKIITWTPVLSKHEPKPRKLWLPEDHRMGIFDAVALAITHNYLKE